MYSICIKTQKFRRGTDRDLFEELDRILNQKKEMNNDQDVEKREK